jgi:hypothetical protein
LALKVFMRVFQCGMQIEKKPHAGSRRIKGASSVLLQSGSLSENARFPRRSRESPPV